MRSASAGESASFWAASRFSFLPAVAHGYNYHMKYSLRSLMTFSIRDLLWLLVVVALLLCLWRQSQQLYMQDAFEQYHGLKTIRNP